MRGVEPELQTDRQWQAAGDFIFGGAGAGLLFFTALAACSNSLWLYWAGLPALVLIGMGLVCAWLELGRKLTSDSVFQGVRTSWTGREAVTTSALFAVALATVVWRLPRLALMAAPLALTYIYCQARMLKAAKGIPAWREPAIVPLIVATGLTEGASAFLIVSAWFSSGPAWVVSALLALVGARLMVWTIYHSRLTAPGAAPKGTGRVLKEMQHRMRLAGHLLPLGFLAMAVYVMPIGNTLIAPLAGLLALSMGWFLKFSLVTRAAYSQGFAIPTAPPG